jgi:23S rRNA (cytidine1920-2'-O)/16S rRNA (cytidine1409-2'-O)-methyltransferase
MRRLDHVLVELRLAPTRTKAQQLIEAGDVEILSQGEWKVIRQSSYSIAQPSRENVRVKQDAEILKYVSRGGLKLEGALEHLQLDVSGFRVLDLGVSTGGFSDCLLQKGAQEICGIDVGHSQLHEKLMREPRLMTFEGVNVKQISEYKLILDWIARGLDLCVVDLSFISLISVLPVIADILPAQTRLLALVKPQFEVGAGNLDKRGLVREDSKLFDDVKARVLHALAKCGFSGEDYFPSRLRGQDGNQEFFVYSRRT